MTRLILAVVLALAAITAQAQVAGPPVGGSGLCFPQQVLTPNGWVTVIVCR